MANAGFFLGGLSDTLNQGLSRNQQAQFQQQELQVQQQGQQMAQKRFEMAQMDKLLSDVGDHLLQTIDAGKVAGEDPKKISAAIGPMVDQYRKLSTAAGRPPDLVDAQINAAFAAPPSTQVMRAQAEAKETPSLVAERQSMAKYRDAMADPFGMNGPSGTGTVAPPGTGNTFQPGETITGIDVQNAPPKPAQVTPTAQSGQGAQGDAYLATLPPKIAPAIKAVGDYDVDLNTMLTRIPGPQRAQFLAMVKQYNKDYSAQDYKARNSANVQWNNPNSTVGKSLRSFNVLTSHLDTLQEAGDALKNKDITALNALGNRIATETGKPAPTTFAAVRDIVGDELVKAITGGASALGDREEVKSRVNAASSPAQLNSVINYYQKLAGGQLSGLRKSYESETGRKDFDKFLTPSAKRQFETGGDQSGTAGISGSSGNVRFSFTPGQ